MWLKYIWLCDLTCDYTLESDVAASGGGRRRVPHPRSGERVAKISPIRKHLTGVSSRFASRTRLNLGRGTGEVDSLKSKVVITLRDLMTSNLFLSDETISSIVSTDDCRQSSDDPFSPTVLKNAPPYNIRLPLPTQRTQNQGWITKYRGGVFLHLTFTISKKSNRCE